MADLPKDRLDVSPPFTFCGVDMFGPYHVKSGRKTVKRYGVIFSCLACRAVHIEVANSLTTDSFINAFRRRSDCGSNFVGADRVLRQELDNINNDKVKAFLLKDSCEYQFNIPHASHTGGVWERQIRSIRRVMAPLLCEVGSQLDEESLHTFCVRPLLL